jgi:hypothetical protein
MLRSGDFRDIEAGEAQRRWWHNRALHNAYGVADGLNCSLVTAAKPTAVSVSCGVAYDCFGHELILEKSQIIPLPMNLAPNLTGAISLLMRYKPPVHRLRPDERSELCWAASGCVATGTVEFVWKLGSDLDPAEGVAVCEVDYSKGRVKGPSFRLRVFAQPQSRPLLATGTTIPGNTPWDPWTAGFITDANQNQMPDLIGVQTWIDTSAAGFTQVPCYFAWLQGPLWDAQSRQLTPAVFPSIADESITGFTFRLWLQVLNPPIDEIGLRSLRRRAAARAASATGFSFVTDPGDFSLFARQQGLYVAWIGCQMQAGNSCCAEQGSAALGAPSELLASSQNS